MRLLDLEENIWQKQSIIGGKVVFCIEVSEVFLSQLLIPGDARIYSQNNFK